MLFLIHRLKRCGRSVSRTIPSVNHGGCAVYASMVASALERAGIKVSGVVMRPPSGDLDAVRQNGSVHEWNGQGVFFRHILVQFQHNGRTRTHDTGHTVTRLRSCTPRPSIAYSPAVSRYRSYGSSRPITRAGTPPSIAPEESRPFGNGRIDT